MSLPALFSHSADDFGGSSHEVLKRVCTYMAPLGSKAPHETFANLTILLQSSGGQCTIDYQSPNYQPNGNL